MDALSALRDTLTENGARRAFVNAHNPLMLPLESEVVLIENFEGPFVIVWYMPTKTHPMPAKRRKR